MSKKLNYIDASNEVATLLYLGITEHKGWSGPFTTKEADNAIPNGKRIEKILYERGDTHPVGALGTVLGSIEAPGLGIAYFIEWDAHPKHAVLAHEKKVKRL